MHGAGNPAELMRDVVAFAPAWRGQEEREQIVRMIQQTAHEWAVHNFAWGREVADMLVPRLDFGGGVRMRCASKSVCRHQLPPRCGPCGTPLFSDPAAVPSTSPRMVALHCGGG